MSRQILAAVCAFYVERARPDLALAFSLAHHGYLRALEVLSLRAFEVAFTGDVRLGDGHDSARAGCVVKDAKTGRYQFVPLSDTHVLGLLEAWLTAREIKGSTQRIFTLSFGQFSYALLKALTHYRLTDVGYTLHSLRHGGAATDWLGKMLLL